MVVGAVFLDLKKAFDLVSHNILIKKPSSYTANSPSVAFFTSYLELSPQIVYINGEYSTEGIIRYGIPKFLFLALFFSVSLLMTSLAYY